MNAQIAERSDSFFMMNFEITFKGVQAWLDMAGHPMDDSKLFRLLFSSDYLQEQAEILRMIVYRYEDVFFQANRTALNEQESDIRADVHEPIHQLLLKMMNQRIIAGEDNALLDLYLILQKDKQSSTPQYTSLHCFFE
ncbi:MULTISPECIES: hypothetical protein [Paenibacillus]|uniref:hypothetical protein n=1 Tax=Paenibacillus TaxID=44249 RepID=UPI00041A23FA|nr:MULTISPECIES: hypothetical protein [Paenibacillus]KGP78100.1 hypothetical protein P364_0130050 [Paenibacillus sp. MAEPY2]KGP89378.1 hypothetical protein P363_0101600 [Paenibacillus sp. MAEPY1]OZQ71070.1 hypothetical protein CA599_11085 [Paenibacillus taichungensis]